MKVCENCEAEHDGSYGSGRFCSTKCARGFSTKAKRKEINEKVSKKLKKELKTYEKECKVCDSIFLTNKENRTVCSKKCVSKLGGLTKNKDTSRMGGPRPGGGRTTVYPYTNKLGHSMKLNKDEIRVAKVLDKLNINWNRNLVGFEYIDLDGYKRKYYPDFYLIDYDLYVEYKGWVTEKIKHKMKDACNKNNFNLKIIYSNDKRYSKLGLSLNELEKNPNLLINTSLV